MLKKMKKTKFKNVEMASNINGLISIFCDHEKRGSKYYHEYFFLNNDFEVKAHFASTGVMRAEQLCEQNETLFEINESLPDNNWDGKDLIVRVNPDLSYDVLHEIEWIEYGIQDGTFAIKKNGLLGFINANGVDFIKPQYDDHCAFENGFACVKQNGKWGFINKNNEIVIPFEYDMPDFCCDEENPVKYNSSSSFVNHNGRLLATVAKGEKWGIIELNNNVILPFKYDWLLLGTGRYIGAKLNHKWGLIDINGNVIVPFIYDEIEMDGNGLPYLTVKKDGLKGLFSYENGLIIPCEYENIEPYHNTICAKKQNGKYVLLGYDNKELTKEYYFISPYPENGLYLAGEDKKHCGYINEQGEIIVPFRYREHPLRFHGGLAVAEYYDYEKGFDVINTKGEILYHAKMYNNVFNIGNGYILAENDNNEFEFIKLI